MARVQHGAGDPYQEGIRERVAERAPLGFAVFLTCVLISGTFEFLRFPQRRPWMAAFGAGFALLVAITSWLLRRRPQWTLTTMIVFVDLVGVAINGYHAVVGASVAMCVWVLTALLCSSAVILPWGRRSQAYACLGVLVSYPVHLLGPNADPLAWGAGGVYLLAVAALSTFGASLFADYVRKDLHLTATLSEREARLQSYFDLSLVGTAIVGPAGRCLEVNEELCRMFGLSRETLLEQPWSQVVTEEDAPVARGLLAQALAGAPEQLDLRCVHSDGRVVHASVAVRGLPGQGGKIDHAMVLVHDITRRREVEIEREHSLERTEAARREAEEASRAKDAFLATVSHELRTPLTPILAWADLLQEGNLGGEKTTRAVTAIQRNARAQARLIDDLLDMSRIVAGEWRMELRAVDLAAVVRVALDVVRPLADAKGVALAAEVPESPLVVQGDAERLQQVVWNLLSNAVKFTPSDGRVDVRLGRYRKRARIEVRDTGAGIPAEFVPHVFEPFRQADATVSRRYAGLGLGLAIVRALVERHGGVVRAESPGEGKGASFTVDLPLLEGVSAATDDERTQWGGLGAGRPTLRGLRVLVVDDDVDSNAVVSALLLARGADVRTASSVAGALEIAGTWRPDVVVSDIAMPGEDGVVFLQQLRARREQMGEVPAIALTALGGSDDRRRLLDAGFQAHVAKPFDPVHLAAVVETAAQSARLAS